jgi:hypothetical protein
MAGGLLNLVAYGNQNIILNGNPTKTFFKTTYAKYTNFGLQKFRIDFSGQRQLRLSESSVFDFTIPRYGDLLLDTYLVVKLPNIWSPIMPPLNLDPDCEPTVLNQWQPYEFKWIENIGTQMIERVRFTVGGAVIQEFTGQYLVNLVERDFSEVKKKLYYQMTGNVPELNDPGNAYGRKNQYPSAIYGGYGSYPPECVPGTENTYTQLYDQVGSEPSIRNRQLYIPLNIWFTLASKMGFPLASLQYAELKIEVTLRPVRELFTVNKIYTPNDCQPMVMGIPIQPNFNESQYQFYRFLQSPPTVDISTTSVYEDQRTNWDADIHLLSTYAFLTDDEVRLFATEPQRYLIRESYTTIFENVVGTKKVNFESLGMVSNWMWFFQRTDVNERNQWSNYTNWPYNTPPVPPTVPTRYTSSGIEDNSQNLIYPPMSVGGIPNVMNPIYNSGPFTSRNTRDIMTSWALLLDGKYRENEQSTGVLDYVEKYIRTSGNAPTGLYCYNFALNSNPFDFQPSGAMNMSKFSIIQFETNTIQPSLDANVQFTVICAPSGDVVATQMPQSGIYQYQYNMVVMEERYNILSFQNGMAGLEFSR